MTKPDEFLERREADLHWLVDRDFAAGLEALGWPDPASVERALAGAGSEGRAATAILALPGRSERIHLRPVHHGGALGPLWRGTLWGSSRPVRELRVNAALARAGAPVPRPLLVAASRRRGPLWNAVFGTLHVEGARDGWAWLAAKPERSALLGGARALGAAIRRFHDAGGQHADLHLKNLLLREDGGRFEAWVIDLDRARCGAPPGAARRARELMRLYRSLLKRGFAEQVGPRGCAAAWQAYCGGDRQLRAALRAALPRERRRVSRHARAYSGGTG